MLPVFSVRFSVFIESQVVSQDSSIVDVTLSSDESGFITRRVVANLE